MRGKLADMGAVINEVSHKKHVPKVEQCNRTMKEHVLSAYNVLQFKHVPPIFIIELVYSQVFWCNMSALKSIIMETQSPSKIILNRKLDFNAHCKVESCEYVQRNKEYSNRMVTRTVGFIATCPTSNSQSLYQLQWLDLSPHATGCYWSGPLIGSMSKM